MHQKILLWKDSHNTRLLKVHILKLSFEQSLTLCSAKCCYRVWIQKCIRKKICNSSFSACIVCSLFDIPLVSGRRKPKLKRLNSRGKFAFDAGNKLREQSSLGVSLWATDSFVNRMIKRNISLETHLNLIWFSLFLTSLGSIMWG